MLAGTCYPSSQVTEAGESWVQGQLGLHNTPLSQTQKKKNLSNSGLWTFSAPLSTAQQRLRDNQSLSKSDVPSAHGPANRNRKPGLS